MLTSRGWWLLLVTLFLSAMGVALSQHRGAMLAILGLTVLAWLVVEWCRFLFALRWGLTSIRVER